MIWSQGDAIVVVPTILFVDNQSEFLDIGTEFLRSAGYEALLEEIKITQPKWYAIYEGRLRREVL